MTIADSASNQHTPSESNFVSPATISEVQDYFRAATKEARPVYVYRPGQPGGVKIDLSGLDRIDIDTANLVAVVGPGVTLRRLSDALKAHGLRFIPGDNPFYQDITIGRFYHQGCSNLAAKYGFAKHFLMGTQIVLPTGDLFKTGGKTVKNVTGYDLTRFMTGPYSNLGLPVEFLLKLLPLPEAKKRMIIRFSGTDALSDFVQELKKIEVIPAYLLWIDDKVQQLMQGTGPQDQLVLLELDGVAEEVQEQWQAVTATLQKLPVAGVEEAADGFGCWTDLFLPQSGFALTDELKFHQAEQKKFLAGFYDMTRNKNIGAGLFGQVAAGSLSVYFSAGDADRLDDINKIMALATEMGGCVAGKFQRMAGTVPASPLLLIERQMKKMFDPADILIG
ncbi:MAG: FAD-binding oxidoreductase [Negativicutes bacterium]|nr:FAD-binding oxidoreductase [Negativicutes bacterium]